MTGLWTARVLTDHFERVTVVDRDALPVDPSPRPGVPQARHIHILLASGWRAMERLFPGLPDELAHAGVPIFDWANESRLLFPDGWGVRYPSGLVLGTLTRDLLEWSLRRRLMAHPHVIFVERREAIGLLASADQARVTGVRLRVRGEGEAPEETLDADLVVDASGRESHAPDWLASLGYARPQETRINAFLGYASRLYQPPPGFKADWKAMIILSRAPHFPRGGGIYPVEGGRWLVTLAGAAKDYPPTDDAGFLDFARSLPAPEVYAALKDAEPLTPISGYRRTENRLRHYERLTRFPDGLVLLGDAVCAFNPVYGQGMTVGQKGALALGECLAAQRQLGRGLARLGLTYQRRLAQVTATAWQLATAVDFKWPGVEGDVRPGRLSKLTDVYMNGLMELATHDPAVNLAYSSVFHLLAPPVSLFRPRLAAKVAAHSLLHRHKLEQGAPRVAKT